MKWPFVRRSKYELLDYEIREKQCLNNIHLEEINRLNEELANEMNSHRETRETKNKVIENNLNQIRGLENFFEREFNLHKETKDALKIAQEDLRIYKELVKSNKDSIKYYLEKAINYL